VRRLISAGDSLTAWLDGFGWDSVKGTEANIWTTVELVDAIEDTVLWRGDTVSARWIDTLDNPIDDLIKIPLAGVVDSGAKVYVRLRTFASDSVRYRLNAGFSFYREDSTGGPSTPKRVVRPEEKEVGEESISLALSIVPNPARDRAELHVWTAEPGTIRVTVWSATGEMIRELPAIEAGEEGTYAIEIDLRNVRPGRYLIRAESANANVTTTITVIR
jgi:hypothetical protein